MLARAMAGPSPEPDLLRLSKSPTDGLATVIIMDPWPQPQTGLIVKSGGPGQFNHQPFPFVATVSQSLSLSVSVVQ